MSPTLGPLSGVRVLEFEGLGPAPFCGMLLADMGADVILLERPERSPAQKLTGEGRQRVAHRGKRSLGVDLKHPDTPAILLRLLEGTDVLLEGFRPGVMERLGLGPDVCLERHPSLIYARMTGWGQTGPLAQTPGHDLNFVALSGALTAGRRHGGAPWAPPSLVGDMGGGGLLLAFGIACALLETKRSGQGQVIDAAMAEGAALLSQGLYNIEAERHARPGIEHLLDASAPFYDVYACADGRWLALAPIEPPFFANLLVVLGLQDDPAFAPGTQFDAARWPVMRARLEACFATADQATWCQRFEGTACCVTPVLDLVEAPRHSQHLARAAFLDLGGVRQPAPAPRLSRTPAPVPAAPPLSGEHTASCLAGAGFRAHEIAALLACGAIQQLREDAP